MKKSILAVSVAALFFTACSNSEDFETPQPQKEIALNPVAQKATRTPITGTNFPTSLSIYVSAWNSVSKDYFKNIEFKKGTESSETTWKAGKLWPVNGVTSFLAYAFTPANNSVMDANTAVWGNETSTSPSTYENWAKQVSFELSNNSLCYNPVAADGSATTVATEGTPYVDLLYANADQAKEKDYKNVEMQFKHAGAWIVFNVKLANDLTAQNSKLTVNTFELVSVHKSGKLTIDNRVVGGAKASWDLTGCPAANYPVESFPQSATDITKGLELTTADQTFGVVLPEQQQTAIQFKYTLSSTNSAFEPQTATYTHNLDRFEKWEMGKKYVYNITISFEEIQIKPSVTDWDDSSENIAI